MAAFSEASLHGSWVRSQEDDKPGELVYRPSGYDFPPSRGRVALDLRADGTYVESGPGPVDVPQEVSGRWTLEGARLVLEPDGGGPGHAWEVTGADEGSLRVRA
jgi:hypothetical protein